MATSYDPKCEELARYFLPSGSRDALVQQLARIIQEAIEDWLEDEQYKLKIQ